MLNENVTTVNDIENIEHYNTKIDFLQKVL